MPDESLQQEENKQTPADTGGFDFDIDLSDVEGDFPGLDLTRPKESEIELRAVETIPRTIHDAVISEVNKAEKRETEHIGPEGPKWEELAELSVMMVELKGTLGKLGDDMTDLKLDTIDDGISVIDSAKQTVGDEIAIMIKLPLEVLRKRLVEIEAAREHPEKHRRLTELYEKYFSLYFEDFVTMFDTLSHDRYVREEMQFPFRKEVANGLFTALKIPPCPEGLVIQYLDQKSEPQPYFEGFADYMDAFDDVVFKGGMNEGDRASIENTIKYKVDELEKKWLIWKDVNDPEKQDQRDSVRKELLYWKQMNVQKVLETMYRWGILGKIRKGIYEPEFISELFYVWESYTRKKKELNEMN